MSQLAKLNNVAQSIKEIDEDVVKGAIREILAPVFAKYPDLNTVGWPQYQQYWNDGEPTTFDVHNYYLEINGYNIENVEPDDMEDGEYAVWEKLWEAVEPELDEIWKIPTIFLENLGEGLVVVGKDLSIDVEHYDHD